MSTRQFPFDRFDFARAAQSMIGPRGLDGLEAEMSAEIANTTNSKPRGFWLPLNISVRSDLTTSAGAGAVPTRLLPTMIQNLRAKSVVGSLGGQFVDLANREGAVEKTKLPRAAAGTIVSYGAEGTPHLNPVLTTTLTADATDSATTITLASVAGLPINGELFGIRVESEIMLVVAVDNATNILTVRRGYFGTTAAAHASGTAVVTTNMLIDGVEYTPRTLTAVIEMTRKAFLQIGPGSTDLVLADIAAAMATEIDRAALSANGVGEQPTGLVYDSRIPVAASLGTNGGAPTRAALIAMEKAVGVANGDAAKSPALGWATSPAGRAKLRSTCQIGTTFPKFLWTDENQVLGSPAAATNNIPSNLTKAGGSNLTALLYGDFSMATVATWKAADVLINPFVNGGMTVRISVFLEFDFQVRQPSSFARIIDLDPS